MRLPFLIGGVLFVACGCFPVPTLSPEAKLESELYASMKSGDTARARLLISKGADPNADDPNAPPNKKSHVKLLFQASYLNKPSIVALLLVSGAHPNDTTGDQFNLTPLMAAAAKDCPTCVSLLLKAGADPFLKNGQNETAMGIAQRLKHMDVARILKTANEKGRGEVATLMPVSRDR